MRLLGLELDNQGLDLGRQLVGVANRPSGAVVQRLEPVFLVTIENLVAGLAGDAELPAHIRHGFPVQQPGDKAKALFHYRTRFPRHLHLPQNKSGKCNPCVRYELSPMSRVAQNHLSGGLTAACSLLPPRCACTDLERVAASASGKPK